MPPIKTEPVVDAFRLAQRCRALVRANYALTTSCIESAFLFERVAHHLGLNAQRVVCQATAMTPLLAQAVAEGQAASALMSQPGYWAVAVGMLQSPEDFVGRVEVEKNRFVGHVVCLAEGHLVDPSVDQLSRPLKGLHIDEPLVADYDGRRVVVGFNRRGSVVKYVLHPDVPVPAPRTDRKLERMAIALAREWAVA